MSRAAVVFPALHPAESPADVPHSRPRRARRYMSGDRLVLLTAFATGILAGTLLL
jgi:hypothetical protein